MHTVLIIEDYWDTAFLVKISLQAQGCEAFVADSRDKALEFIQRHGLPDTIIMDWNMPGMSVEDFLSRLASFHTRMPRLILTTAATDADEVAKHFNIAEVLRKPFDLENLLAQVDCCR